MIFALSNGQQHMQINFKKTAYMQGLILIKIRGGQFFLINIFVTIFYNNNKTIPGFFLFENVRGDLHHPSPSGTSNGTAL